MENPDFLLEHLQQKLAFLDGIKNIVKGPPIPSPSTLLPTNKKEIHQHHGLAHYVLTLFKFLECFWVIPFKIQPTKLPNEASVSGFHIVSSKWKRKFIQFVMFVITVYHIYLPIKILNNNGARFYSVIRAVINFSLTCWSNVIVITLWKRRSSIIRIISRIDRVAKLLGNRTNSNILNLNRAFWLAASISLSCVILSILEVLVFSFRMERILNFSFFTILKGEAKDMAIIFPGLELENYVFGRFILVTFGLFHCILNKMYYFYIGHFGYAILFIFSHVISKLLQTLNTKVLINSSLDMEKVLDSYVEIRKLLGLVNRTFGSMMAWGINAHLPYNAYKVKDLIDGSTCYQVSYIIHYIMYLGILLVAARVHAEVAIFVEKLTARALVLNDNLLESRIMLIVQQAKTTGMKGNSLFMITYGFFGNIIGVVLTYAILIVQFQKN